MKGEEVIELDFGQRKAVWPSQAPATKPQHNQFAAWQSLIEALSDFLDLSVHKQMEAQCRAQGPGGVWTCTAIGSDRSYEVRLGGGQLVIEGRWGGDAFKLKATQLEEKQNYYQLIEVQHMTKPPVSAKFFVKECRADAK